MRKMHESVDVWLLCILDSLIEAYDLSTCFCFARPVASSSAVEKALPLLHMLEVLSDC